MRQPKFIKKWTEYYPKTDRIRVIEADVDLVQTQPVIKIRIKNRHYYLASCENCGLILAVDIHTPNLFIVDKKVKCCRNPDFAYAKFLSHSDSYNHIMDSFIKEYYSVDVVTGLVTA